MAKQMRFLPPWGPYYEVDTDQEAADKARQAGFIGKPPSQIYKDEGDDTIRGEGPEQTFAPNPAAYNSGPRPTDAPRAPAVNPTFPSDGGGGGQRGPSFTGTFNTGTMKAGGNNMSGIRTQHSNLDPNVWGRGMSATDQGQQATMLNSAGATGAADALMGVNPQVGPMDRTLYDKYQGLLMDPSSIQSSANFGFQLDQAQNAARRQLAAGRGRHSGRALEELAGVTVGNIGSQFRDLAGIYGQGAGEERARWQGQTGAGLDAARIRAGALQGAGGIYSQAGQLASQGGDLALRQAGLDLGRVEKGIASPTEQYQGAINAANSARAWNDSVNASNAMYASRGYGFGGVSSGYMPQASTVAPSSYESWVQSNWGR